MATAFVVSVVLQTAFGFDTDNQVQFAYIMLITVGITTVVWLAVTFMTAPEPEEKLVAFYRQVRPSVALWKPIARLAPDVEPARDGFWNLVDWLCGCVLIYGTLFGTGKLILKDFVLGFVFLAIGMAAGAVIYWDLSRRGWKTVID